MIFLRRCLLLTCLYAAALVVPAAHAAKRAASPEVSSDYKGAIALDAATGQVLFEDNADLVTPPASMTKLMTFLVLQDKIHAGALTLQTPIDIVAADTRIGGTQVWLKEHEQFSVDELLYAMMIQSANDAAYALARTSAGSPGAFVELMNAKARELGMTHTTFRTPHGLPPASRKLSEGDLTTPRDFAILSRALVLKTDVLKYASIKSRDFGTGVRAQVVVMNNHNHLLRKVAGVDGLKTGFTNGAGFCLAATAQRNGRRVIVVVMGSSSSKNRDLKVAELIERAFSSLPPNGPAFTAETPHAAVAAGAANSPLSVAPLSAAEEAAEPADDAAPTIKFSVPPAKKK